MPRHYKSRALRKALSAEKQEDIIDYLQIQDRHSGVEETTRTITRPRQQQVRRQMKQWQCGYGPLAKWSISESKIISIHLHRVQTEIGGVEGYIKMLPG